MKNYLYCLVFAKTPNHSTDENDGKNIIYITTWKFDTKNEALINTQLFKVKVFENETIMNVRGGKYGDDKVFIIYSFKTENSEDIGYGHVDMGTIPYLIIYDLSTSKIIKDGIKMDNFVMNTNEDLKTFNDGVLIWASTNKESKLGNYSENWNTIIK